MGTNAKGVSLIGEFNHWDGNESPMRVLGSSGVWELFWPGFRVGEHYKFRVFGADGSVSDPSKAVPRCIVQLGLSWTSGVTRSSSRARHYKSRQLSTKYFCCSCAMRGKLSHEKR